MTAVASKGTAVLTTPTDTQIKMVREFDAPKHLVYKAWTTPELVARWWASDMGRMTVTDIDLRVGGSWRWVMIAGEEFEVAFHGTYKEIEPNSRLVYTEVYEMPGVADPDANAIDVTCIFEEKDGRTTLTQISECHTKQIRDAILESGMESGAQKSMDFLEEVAISLL